MKGYLKYVMAILLMTAFTVIVKAQVKPGYIFGMNFSTVTLSAKGRITTPERPAGFHFGATFQIPVSGYFTFDPGIILSAKGSNFKIDTVEFSLSPIYIEIPLTAMYSFGSDIIRITLFGGPYGAIGVGGYKIEPGGELKDINWGSGKNSDLRQLDFGLNFGAGLNIKGLLITAQYAIGLVNIAPETAFLSEMKNNVIGISISSLFMSR